MNSGTVAPQPTNVVAPITQTMDEKDNVWRLSDPGEKPEYKAMIKIMMQKHGVTNGCKGCCSCTIDLIVPEPGTSRADNCCGCTGCCEPCCSGDVSHCGQPDCGDFYCANCAACIVCGNICGSCPGADKCGACCVGSCSKCKPCTNLCKPCGSCLDMCAKICACPVKCFGTCCGICNSCYACCSNCSKCCSGKGDGCCKKCCNKCCGSCCDAICTKCCVCCSCNCKCPCGVVCCDPNCMSDLKCSNCTSLPKCLACCERRCKLNCACCPAGCLAFLSCIASCCDASEIGYGLTCCNCCRVTFMNCCCVVCGAREALYRDGVFRKSSAPGTHGHAVLSVKAAAEVTTAAPQTQVMRPALH